ncbi:hypothetical protein [Polaromonas sp. YR568]|uniref:RHS repeat domain-containing protein n=1 Tax=Polaromonas sp. YR568 TaxID=1855301 RepID=UPI003137DF48
MLKHQNAKDDMNTLEYTGRFSKHMAIVCAVFIALLGSTFTHAEIYYRHEKSGIPPNYLGLINRTKTVACDGVEECSNECINDVQNSGAHPDTANFLCHFNPTYGVAPPSLGGGFTVVEMIGGSNYYVSYGLAYIVCSAAKSNSRAYITKIWDTPYTLANTDSYQCLPTSVVNKAERKPKSDICAGNPIYPMTGTKREVVDTGIVIGNVPLQITYDSVKKLITAAEEAETYAIAQQSLYGGRTHGELPSFGALWASTLHRKLDINLSTSTVTAYRGTGNVVGFTLIAGAYAADADVGDQLIATSDGFLYVDLSANAVEKYTSAGQLVSIHKVDGKTLNFAYSNTATPVGIAPAPGYLISISEDTGRAINFEYVLLAGGRPGLDGRVSKLTNSESQSIGFTYHANGNLVAITWASNAVKNFVYENSSLPWALTGVIDELGQRHSTFTYDSSGMAVSTENAGGVNRYSASYGLPPKLKIVNAIDLVAQKAIRTYSWEAPANVVLKTPNGSDVSLLVDTTLGYPQLAGQSQAAGSGCASSNNASTFDVKGNILSRDNFQGQRSCFAYDGANREIVRVEGLATSVACSTVTPAGATLPTGARKITTAWHPDWHLSSQVSAPLHMTTSVYHGQPDPFNNNAAASCTTTPLLPNGKPMPLLCKQVEQVTLSNGAPDPAVAARTSQYTYDGAGRLLVSVDANALVTAYTYYGTTSFTGADPHAVGQTVGDLQSITNDAGHVTQFPLYDKAGRIRQMIDPKGVVTDITYTPRGWVSTVSTTAPGSTARVTSYSYDSVGQLTGVTQPDGSTLSYSYDAAHRLVGVTDAKGNTISYTLDNVGNRIGEEVRDPGGSLQRAISRSFDALNRLQQVTGAAQ